MAPLSQCSFPRRATDESEFAEPSLARESAFSLPAYPLIYELAIGIHLRITLLFSQSWFSLSTVWLVVLDFIVHLFTAMIVAWLSQFITMSRLTVPSSRRISAALPTAKVSAWKTVEFGPRW